MYSNVNNKKETASTLSVTEMLGFMVIVGSSLYLLYPKGEIEKEISENKAENRQLSINYLNSMLGKNPNSLALAKELITKYTLNGEFDKALALNREFIGKTKNTIELESLYKEEYLLLKKQYFQLKTDDKKAQLSELNEKLYHLFLYASDSKDYQFLFNESISMDFKEVHYKSLQHMIKQKPVTLKFKEDALNFFISYKKMEEAELLIVDLIEDESRPEKRLEYFKTAFYILAKDKVKNREKIEELIQSYTKKGLLHKDDLNLISNTYFQIDQKEAAADFIYESFHSRPSLFDEKNTFEAIRILSYSSQLKRALELSNFAYERYPSRKSLDSTIQLSTWLSQMNRVTSLNTEGWRKYNDKKYENYLLEKTTYHNSYKVRGEIYKKSISEGDLTVVPALGEYYEYTGEISKAEEYFTNLLKKHPEKSIYKEAIRFSHDNSNYKQVDKLYHSYREKFGVDKEIHKKLIDEYIATKQLDKAYKFTQELKSLTSDNRRRIAKKTTGGHHHGAAAHHQSEKDYSIILKELAWIEQDFQYLYDTLWEEEKGFTKRKNSYAQLISFEDKLSKKPRLEYLYRRAFEITENRAYIEPLLSIYMGKKEYEKFNTLLSGVKEEDLKVLEKRSSFHMLLANYHQGVGEYDQALASFSKAIKLDPKSAEVHQAYLWFLVNNGYYNELKNEYTLMKRDKKLQQKIAFPSVVAALKLDKADMAKKWLKPLLKSDKDKLEYKALFADILEFEGKHDEAQAIRFKLFRAMHRKVDASEELLKDKEFAQLYLQMALSYKFPYSKKVHYMKKFKSLFTKEEYLEIELGFYSSQHMLKEVNTLVDKHKLNYPWLNLYLATQRGDKEFIKKAYKENQIGRSLKDRISIAIDSDHKDDAYTLLFNGMNDNRDSISLATTYWRLANEAFPKSTFSVRTEHLSKNTTLNSVEFSSKYALNNNLNIGISLLKEKFIHAKKENRDENSLAFSLSNHDSDFLWSVNLGRYFGDSDYYYSQFMLHYDFKDASVELNVGNNNKTYLTPKLQTYAVEDSNSLAFTYNVNERNQLGLSYTQSDYHLKEGTYLGKGDIIQLSNTQLFRLGYPDITLFNHINIENFDFENKNMGLSSFTEVGSELTVGASAKHELRKSWRPYMSLGMALNDHRQLGSSLSVGAAGMLYQADKLDFSLRYIKGVNNLNEELYGAYLDYSY